MRKRIISLTTSMVMMLYICFCLLPAPVKAISDNNGVYEIATAQDLVDFSSLVNSGETSANAILTADIDMTGIDFDPIGTYSDYSGVRGYGGATSYKGTFDGNGYIIRNLTVSTNEKIETGLFGRASNATIQNVGIMDAKITNSAEVRTGILAGELIWCKVSNIRATGIVLTDNVQKGGVSGESCESTLSNCFSSFAPYTNNLRSTVTLCGTCDTLFAFDGFGVEQRPFLISNAEDLKKLSELMNSSSTHDAYYKSFYRQTNNIDLNGENFEPIGAYSEEDKMPFSFGGIYDGNYKEVKNLYVSDCNAQGGLFALVAGGMIKNLSVYGNIDLEKEDDIGGVVGNIHDSTILNCSFNGSISGSGNIGGVVGKIWRAGRIDHCYFNGTVSVKDLESERKTVGGIVGAIYAGYNDTIQNVGIYSCYAAGKITSLKTYNTGEMFGFAKKNNENSQIEMNNNYYLNTMCGSTASPSTQNGCTAFNSNALKACADMLEEPFVDNTNTNLNDGYPVFEWQLPAESFNGLGTVKSPYLIESKEDLYRFEKLVNSNYYGDDFKTACYKQTVDIDLQDEQFTSIGIGYENCFMGVYDGNYHTIRGLNVKETAVYAGLFKVISGEASIRNLAVQGSVSSTNSYVGGLVGEIGYGASISNCCFIGNVKGAKNVGGIAGKIWDSGVIFDSYVYGDVSGEQYVGGVVGHIQCTNSNGTGMIRNSYFAGSVSGETSAGLVGLSEYNESNGNAITIKNTYYLKTASSVGVNGDAVIDDNAAIPYNLMKKLATDLGDRYISNANPFFIDGNPCFTWQVYGDVNDDDKITIADVVMLQKYLIQEFNYTENMQYTSSDINQDGYVNGFDLTLLKQILIQG